MNEFKKGLFAEPYIHYASFNKGYNKAIDDFIKECDKYCGFYKGEFKNLTRETLLSIAEQLKEGGAE